ncbi:hypothetical protein B0H10DRAFT_2011042 [Mycena sp. CBHHK59/15]|nr:hypothetical protein B0H10DRAFT_2011042 [Mycena sp. CBHHK59/15]
MTRPYFDYNTTAGPSYPYPENTARIPPMSHDYPTPYATGAGANAPCSSTPGYLDAPSYNYLDSPDAFPCGEFASSTPLSASSSASSSSSCSDAPSTPSYALPEADALHPRTEYEYEFNLDHECCDGLACPKEAVYGYGYGYEDAPQPAYRSVALPESSVRTSAPSAHFPTYATFASSDFSAVTSSAVSPPHPHHDYPGPSASTYSPSAYSFVSPAMLSSPPPLKLHQPQPRRSIPVVSLVALASGSPDNLSQHSSAAPTDDEVTSPALSPLELQQFPFSQRTVTSYSALPTPNSMPSSADSLPLPYLNPCYCPDCVGSYT